MAGMRIDPQRIDDPYIKPAQHIETPIRDAVEIGCVGKAPDPESQRLDRAVMNAEGQQIERAPPTLYGDATPRHQPVEVKNGRIVAAGSRVEAVAETRRQQSACGLVGPNRNPFALAEIEGAQFIDA